jgi:DNA-binding NarL/FixJ family response regulator
VKLGRRLVLEDFAVLDQLADGKRPRAIAAEVGCAESTLRKRLSRAVRNRGFKTPEQAVAHRVADRIQRELPLALHQTVDRVMKRSR